MTETYICRSVTGCVPTFTQCGTGKECYPVPMGDVEIHIVHQCRRYRYRRGFVDFKPGRTYTMDPSDPTTFYGKPELATDATEDILDEAAGLLHKILAEHGFAVPESVCRQALNQCSFELKNKWDGTEKSFRKILSGYLDRTFEPYDGSAFGFALHTERNHILWALLLPDDYSLLLRIEDNLHRLPKLRVSWSAGKMPQVFAENGISLRKCVETIISPE